MPKIYTDDDAKKWKVMKDKGYPLKEISKKYKVFGSTVLNKIKEYEAKLAAKEAAKAGTVGEEAKSPVGEEASKEEELPPYVRKTPLPKDKKKSEGDKMAQPTGRLDEDERIEAKKSLRFDPDLLKIAEWTVGQGLAKDLSSAIRAWGKDYYYRHSDVLTEEGDLVPKTQKGGNDLGKEIDFGDVIKLMKQRAAIETMATFSGEKSGGGGINLDKIIALSFLEKQQNRGDGNTGLNPQIQALQSELKSLRDSQMQQAQMQKFEQMFQNLQNQIIAQAQNKGGDWKEIFALTEKGKADLEKIRADHENRMEEQRARVEQAKDETSKIRFEHLQDEVKGQMSQAAEAYKWKDELSKRYMDQAMTILDDQYKRGAKAVSGEKSTGELAKDFVTDFIGQIKGPILEPMGKALASKMVMAPQESGLSAQQAQVVQQAQEKYRRGQQQLAKEAELRKQGPYDSMD